MLGVGLFLAYTRGPVVLYGTLWILFLAYLTIELPAAYQQLQSAFQSVHPELEEAARLSGAGRMRTLRDILAPLLKSGVIAAWCFIFIGVMRELSAAVMLFTAHTKVISVVIYDLNESGDLGAISVLGIGAPRRDLRHRVPGAAPRRPGVARTARPTERRNAPLTRIAVLDDYQGVALAMADWSRLQAACEVVVFRRNLASEDEAAAALAEFDVLCLMRERMPVPRSLIERLPRLKLIVGTGAHNRTLDLAAAKERGIAVSHTRGGDSQYATPELAWGLILSLMRHIPDEHRRMREGGWQESVGTALHGRTLSILGLGRLGTRMAAIGHAFGMEVLAWSPNLTRRARRGRGRGARLQGSAVRARRRADASISCSASAAAASSARRSSPA